MQDNHHDISVNVKITDFCERLGLEVLNKGDAEYISVSTFNINRPGLQLAGFFEHVGSERVQVIGEMEMSYLMTMAPEHRWSSCDRLFSLNFPCVVLSTGLEPIEEIISSAKKYNRVLLRTSQRSTLIINELSIFLNELLAPTQTVHGVLIDIYGVGVLIIGNSSIGKSETALELVQRGHRLVADDAVTIKHISGRLFGSSPPIIRYFMEVRGIGIIDIRSMYGAGAVRQSKTIEMVIELEAWDENKNYDRLGNLNDRHVLLDVTLPKNIIPVKPGRNLASILEVASKNYILKTMGYDTLKELDIRMSKNL